MTDFDGFDELADELESFAARAQLAAELMPRAIDSGVETTARDVEAAASIKAPKDDNRLANSIHSDQQKQMHWIVGTNVHYAPHIEYGRGPIVADDGYLRFEIDGEVLYRKSVGPAKAQPYLRPALQEHQSDLVNNIQEAIDDMMQEVFG